MLASHAFVDETKEGGYLVVAAVIVARDLDSSRTQMRALCLPGQVRLHFTKESPPRRRKIAAAICRTSTQVHIYDGSAYANEREAREACLRQLVVDLAEIKVHRLVIERDDSLVHSDVRVVREAMGKAGAANILSYEHLPPRAEPLLWIADAAAWCWTHGPQWRERITPVVARVIRV